MSSGWSDMREAGVMTVANAFGLECKRPGSPRHGLAPCPACGVDDRSTKNHRDKNRGPVGLTRDGLGWCCHVCGVKGDAVTLASWMAGRMGTIDRDVAEACKQRGLLGDGARQKHRPLDPYVSEFIPTRQLSRFLKMLVPIAHPDAMGVRMWLMSRRIDPNRIPPTGVIKALPERASGLPWAQCRGRAWSKVGYRLIAPLYNADGFLRGVHARSVVEGLDPKGANPAGYEVAGLTLACPLAQSWLRGNEFSTGKVLSNGLVIVEGLVDWVTQVAEKTESATIGVMSGSWTQEHADKVPDGCMVMVATDHDADGEKYTEKIRKTLLDRVSMRRWTSPEN